MCSPSASSVPVKFQPGTSSRRACRAGPKAATTFAGDERLAEAERLYRAGRLRRASAAEGRAAIQHLAHPSAHGRRHRRDVALHLGVRTRLVNEEWKVFVTNRRQGRLTEVFRGGWIADWRDAANFLQLFVSDHPGNYTFFDDQRYDELMGRTTRLRGPERLEMLRAAESRLLEAQAIIPLYYYVSRHLVKPEVSGFKDNPMDVHLSRWMTLP
jgi:oligopeptide transport system substrate-binding protein